MFRRRKVDPLRTALVALYNVRASMQRLDELIDRVESRRNKLMDMVVELQARGETYLAKKYASEVAKLDGIRSRLSTLRLVLEKVSLALDMAISMKEFREAAKMIAEIASELRKLPEANVPDIGVYLAEFDAAIRELASSEYTVPDVDYRGGALDEGAAKVLEEARAILRAKLESQSPPAGG
ncbi:MAG: hypothetical protein ABWK00_02180 [Desulfurococcaceae archaeon]